MKLRDVPVFSLGLVAWVLTTSTILTLPTLNHTPHRVVCPADAPACVLLFTSLDCPAARKATPRVLATCAAAKVPAFVIFVNASDTVERIRAAQIAGTCLRDADQRAVARFGVESTPTVVVLDATQNVVYHGPDDDGRPLLRDALTACVAKQPPTFAKLPVNGCPIERPLPTVQAQAPTYAGQVGQLLHRHCANCHRPGAAGPFALLTYADARQHAHKIRRALETDTMPPWKPTNHGTFQDELWLPPADKATLLRWIAGGAPRGDATQEPAPPTFKTGWQLGTPDLILTMPEYTVAASGPDEYRCFVLNPNLAEDRYVAAVEFLPGNSTVLHHAMTYIDTSGVAALRFALDGKPGYSTGGTSPGFVPVGDLGGWGPGTQPRALPAGTARWLPQNSRIVLECHYHKTGKPETDRTQMGIYFAKGPVTRVVKSQVVLNLKFTIPPDAKRHEVTAGWTVPRDVELLSIQPHMHLLGREMHVTAKPPERPEQTLIQLKNWDFNWQQGYQYRNPLTLPAGTRVQLRAWFDNSATNPYNPHRPPKPVRFGLGTNDEMCVAYLLYTVAP
jgi:mono/diheme cytochrome c family protein